MTPESLENCSLKTALGFFGLTTKADPGDLERAFKALAKKFHPDKNLNDPRAERRFALIVATYYRLKEAFQAEPGRLAAAEEEKITPSPPFPQPEAVPEDFAEPAFVPGECFPAANQQLKVRISLLEALRGTNCSITLREGFISGRRKRLIARIPPRTPDGSLLRLPKAGFPLIKGGPASDVYVKICVRGRPQFKIVGADLHMDWPVSSRVARCGGTLRVPTPHGVRRVILRRGFRFGTTVRVRGLGFRKGPGDGQRGDLLLTLRRKPGLLERLRAALGSIFPHRNGHAPLLEKDPFVKFPEFAR